MKWSLLILLNLVWLALARVLVPLNRLFLEGAQPGRDGFTVLFNRISFILLTIRSHHVTTQACCLISRHCTEFQLGRRPDLKPLPEEREGRTYVAFALRQGNCVQILFELI